MPLYPASLSNRNTLVNAIQVRSVFGSHQTHKTNNGKNETLLTYPANIHSWPTQLYKKWTLNLVIGGVILNLVFLLFCFVNFFFLSDYIKVIDGNGITVISRYGYSSVTQRTLGEVSFGNSGNIIVQIYLQRYSTFKLQVGILKQESGQPLIC